MPLLFDPDLRAMRRDRAARGGPELFLAGRAFDDCMERLALVQRRFARALLIGCPDAAWPGRLADAAAEVEVRDPGALFAAAASGEQIVEDASALPPAAYDLVVAVGTLDTVNDLPLSLRQIRAAMPPDGLFIAAMSGGDTLPQLRSAMRAADQAMDGATPHVHPRIEPAAVAPLLESAGFVMPVVDVDRVPVSYPSLARLVRDLRAIGATNILTSRSRQPLSRTAVAAASAAFASAGEAGRTVELFEILNFAAWTAE